MKKIIAVIVLLMLSTMLGCDSKVQSSANAKKSEQKCSAKGTDIFFPEGQFDPKSDGELEMARMYTVYLSAMEEPAIHCTKRADLESYRLIWSGPQRAPLSIRAQRTGEDYQLIVKELLDHSRTERGAAKVLKKKLDQSQWLEIKAQIEQASFWQLPSKPKRDTKDSVRWIFEGLTPEKYHNVERWSTDAEKMQDLFLHLAKLSGIELKPEYIARVEQK